MHLLLSAVFPCDWGITPVNSDDHIRICISEARTASQNEEDSDILKHELLAVMPVKGINATDTLLLSMSGHLRHFHLDWP